MNLRLTSLNRTYVPDIMVLPENAIDETARVNNRSLLPDDRIRIELTLANGDQKVSYTAGYATFDRDTKETRHVSSSNVNRVVEKHVKQIFGLESVGITTSTMLVKKASDFEEISEIVLSCYNVIMGAESVDYDPALYQKPANAIEYFPVEKKEPMTQEQILTKE